MGRAQLPFAALPEEELGNYDVIKMGIQQIEI